jgi:hypothetical protein
MFRLTFSPFSSVGSLSVERAKAAGLLWVLAALATALFNDSLAASKEPASGLLNAVTIVGQARAVQLHNVFVDCFCEEAGRFLAEASPVGLLGAILFAFPLYSSSMNRILCCKKASACLTLSHSFGL